MLFCAVSCCWQGTTRTHWQSPSSAQCVISIAVFCQYCFIIAFAQCFRALGEFQYPERRESENSPRAQVRALYIRGVRRSGPDGMLGGILECVLG